MRRQVMVTGANGFVGRHTVRELSARGHEVVAVSRQKAADPEIVDLIDSYFCADLANLAETRELPFDKVDAVINLAGLAAVGESYAQPELYRRVNPAVADTVCTCVREQGRPATRVLAISTAAVYAAAPIPLAEDAALDGESSPYADSKLQMEGVIARHRLAGLDCLVVRPFNHIGPGQGPGFLVPDLAAQIRSAVATSSPLRVGDLSTRRDYTDVRDVVAAYLALILAETTPDPIYNVCSGRSVAGSDILEGLLSVMGYSALGVEVDPGRLRPTDRPNVVGDSARLRADTGWAPRIPLRQSLHDFLVAEGEAA